MEKNQDLAVHELLDSQCVTFFIRRFVSASFLTNSPSNKIMILNLTAPQL